MLFYLISIMSPASNRVKAQADNDNSKFCEKNRTKEKSKDTVIPVLENCLWW